MIGADCSIGRQVKLTGPVVIGRGCQILSGTIIEESVIWRDAHIGQHVSLKGSIVADHCCLNDDSTCEDSVLGNNVTVGDGGILKLGSRIWPGTMVGEATGS